jgi:hypothetical protein
LASEFDIDYTAYGAGVYEVEVMALDELWQAVPTSESLVQELVASFATDAGLLNPVIVVQMPPAEIREYFESAEAAKLFPKYAPEGLPEVDVVNVIWGGNNRVEALREAGYTHTYIIRVPTFSAASRVQRAHRKSYKQLTG